MPRWPDMDPSKRCTAHKPDGSQCKRARKPGTTVCEAHGAKAPQVKAAAERREAGRKALELAERIDVEVPEFASAGDAARFLLGRVSKRSAQFGALADRHGDAMTYTDRAGTERLRAAVIGERAWLDSLARVLGVLVAAEAAHERSSVDREQLIDDVAAAVGRGITTVVLRHPEWGPAGEVHGEITGTVRAALVAGSARNSGSTRTRPEAGRSPLAG